MEGLDTNHVGLVRADAYESVGGWSHTAGYGERAGRVPGVGDQARAVVERVEEFLCWMTAETRSPSVTHAWFGSRWARGVAGELAPVTLVACEPTLRRAMADLQVGAELHRRSSYPPASWFAEQGIPAREVPSASWWANTSGWGYGRDAVFGGVSVIAWLVGGMDDIGGLVPRFYEDGIRIPRELRRRVAPGAGRAGVRAAAPPGGGLAVVAGVGAPGPPQCRWRPEGHRAHRAVGAPLRPRLTHRRRWGQSPSAESSMYHSPESSSSA